jgi:hypothetical protein
VWQSIAYYGVLLVESVLGVFGIRLYEEPRYDVINRVGDRVEIRRYGSRLAAEVDLAVAGEAGRSEAFKLLFAYIAGANRASVSGNDRIAMTVPVEVSGKERLAMTAPVQTSETNGKLKIFAREIQPRKRAKANKFPGPACNNFKRDDCDLAFFRLGSRFRRTSDRTNGESCRI